LKTINSFKMKTFVFFLLASVIAIQVAAQEQFVLKSNFLNRPDTVWVFIPEDSKVDQLHPLLYLLHGWSGNYHQWDDIIDCQTYANRYGFIVVCPDGLYDSWYIDSPVEGENQYEQFFEKDLIPFISEKYPVDNEPVFITGFSMGGHGALYLFEKNPDYFTSAGSLSGLLDLQDWSDEYGIDRVLGLSEIENDSEILELFSVAGNTDQLNLANRPIVVSCGTEDDFYKINVDFAEVCEANHIDIQFINSQGNHNSEYWHSAIKAQVEFFYRMIQ